MIKPPAMGVFARDDPPPSHRSQPPHLPHAPTPVAPSGKQEAETIESQQEEDGQDDDQGTVDEEAGIIRCICSCDEDDGFTIQCDRCLVWQHCACFGMSQASVPDEYLCEQCAPRPVDVAFAVAHQQKRKNNEARKALMDRNLKKQAQALVSASYTQDYLAKEAASSTMLSPSSMLSQIPPDSSLGDEQTSLPASVSYSNNRLRKPSQALDLSNTQFVVPDVPASAGSNGRGTAGAAKQRKGQKGSRRGPETPTAATTPSKGTFTPGSSNERYEDPFDLAEQLEAWHVEFTPISKNVVADPAIIHSLAAAMLDWEDGSPLKAHSTPSGRVVAPVSSRLQRSLLKLHDAMDEDDISPPREESPADESAVTLSAIGNECVPVEMQGPSLADLAARTYVRHISETASAGVFSNVVHATNTAEEPQPGWCASKAFSRPVMHGLFADSPIAAGTFVSEFRGELYGADSYRSNPINQFAALGATKSHVHLFPPPLNLAIDARRFGNEARFARFSCHPNAVLRPILFRRSAVRSHVSSRAPSPLPFAARHSADPTTAPESNASNEPELLFGIFAISDIPRTHEVTLGWEWDDAHIVHFLPELVRNPCMLSAKTFDPDVHTANMVALAERGDFPYAYTEFSTKMRTVAAALLGSVLCSCIGSAAPPGGGGGASTNNGRKQDCAVAQMLRVGNGMSLLNVPMPGKSNRRARLPDFTPLVGIRRHWRVLEIPPTPDVSVKDHGSGSSVLDSEERTQAVLASNADRRRLFSYGYEDFSCGAAGSSSGSRFKRSKHASKLVGTTQGDHSQDDDDARSVASSLTDPLSGLSYDDNSSDEEDIDLTRALRLADGLGSRPISVAGSRTSQQDPDHSGLFLLPPKKRSLRTRIKVLRSPSDDGNDDGSLDESETLRSDSRRSSGTSVKIAVLPTKQSGTKRKTARIPSRLSMNFDSDDEDQMRNAAMLKKRRKSSNIADPSSPLSSVPSPETDRSSLSPRPGPRLSSKHRSESERRLSDLELSKQKRAARRGKDRGSKVSSKASTIKTKKRKDIRSHRQSLLGMADSETSDDSNDSHPVGLSMNLGDGSKTKAVGRTDRDMAGPSNEDTLTKVKKSRRVLSDSDSSLHEDGDAGTRSTHQSTSQVKTETDTQIDAAGAAISLDLAGPDSKIVPALDAESSAPTAIARATREADINIPEIEVKKEEPRVKLSLAEYKRRLAERRVSEQQRQETSLSASAGTPPSELDGSEKQSQDLLRPPPATGAPLHPVESPVSPQPSSVATVKQAPTSAVEPSRSFLFTSTSAPTAIRSVEIPKSPSPEPQRPIAEAASSSQQAAATPAGRIGVTDSASASGDLHIRNSPSSIAAQPSAPPANSVGPLSAASLSDTSSRPPPSPSAAAAFNPPKAPRSYMAGVPVTPPSATGSATYMAPPGSSIPDPGSSVAGATASSANAAMPRYPGGNMTSPSPTSAFTPGPSPRDFAGVPKGPASMRDQDQVPPPVRDAWAEAREQREFANRVVGADHGYRDPREAAWAERERMRWEREASHRPERDPRDSRSASRDDRELAAAAQAARLDYHHQQYPQPHPYRRPSMNDYEDHIPPAGMSYDRPADPYGRGMMGQPRDGREMRDYRDIHDYRDPRDYDLDLGGGAPHPNQHAYAPRGGYRGGWGGGGRSRGRGTGRGGRGGGWMR